MVYIVLDDVGSRRCRALAARSRPLISTRIAADGLRYTQWHTTALCSPTRSCLLTGRNHTRNSMACITEARQRIPQRQRHDPARERHASRDPRRVGLEHLHGRQVAPVPDGRDEPRIYASQLAHRAVASSAGTGSSAPRRASGIPELTYDNHPVDQPKTPEEGYHFGEDITDKAIEFIMDAKAVAPEKPFFLYYAPGACHAPHHAPRDWIDRYKGQFDMGYEAMREATLARQKEMGIVPADTELPPINPLGTAETRTGPDGQPFPPLDVTRPWDSLSDDEKRLVRADGRGVRRVSSPTPTTRSGACSTTSRMTGQRENTLIIVVSDNGASGEGGPDGSVNEMKFMNGIPDDITANLAMLDELGGPKTYNHYPNGWAMAFNTPFKMWKRYEFNGGTSDPCVISWPAGSRRRVRSGAVPPRDRPGAHRPGRPGRDAAGDDQGTHAEPFRRREHALQLRRRRLRPVSGRPSSISMLGSRGIWHDGWKAITTHPTLSGWAHFNDDEWELYHTDVDRSELHNLAADHPEKLREMVNLWYAEAGANDGFPLDDRSALEILVANGRSSAHRAAATSTSRTMPRCPRRRRWSSVVARS